MNMQSFPMTFSQLEAFSAQYTGDREGFNYENGVLTVPDEVADAVAAINTGNTGANLAALKVTLKSRVDAAAETERGRYITVGPGQAMTYLQKSDEAARYLSSTDPDPSTYPMLSAEIGITAPDLAGVAAVVNGAFLQWQMIGAAIEAARLGAKKAIDDATSAKAANAAADAVVWPSP